MTEAGAGDVDSQVRIRAFEFLAERTRLHTDTVPWQVWLSDRWVNSSSSWVLL